MKRSLKNQGFMAIEILIAVSIIAISILAATAVAQKSIYVSRQSFHTTQSSFLLEEGAEAIRISRDNAWSNISGLTNNVNYYPKFSNGTWSLTTNSTDGIVGIFTRTIRVADVNRDNTTKDIVASGGTVDTGTRLVTISVSWIEGGRTVTKTLKFYIADIFS